MTETRNGKRNPRAGFSWSGTDVYVGSHDWGGSDPVERFLNDMALDELATTAEKRERARREPPWMAYLNPPPG